MTTPNTDVNTPAACFIFSNVIFVPKALLALMLCRFNQDSKFSLGNFSFCKTADMTFGLFNINIFCCSHTYAIYEKKTMIDMLIYKRFPSAGIEIILTIFGLAIA